MPKESRQPRDKKLVVCRCESYCLKKDPGTGRFFGSGERIRVDIRTRHRRDDRLRRLLQPRGPEGGGNTTFPEVFDEYWLQTIQLEVQTLGELPTIQPGVPLQFQNDPLTFGDYDLNAAGLDYHIPNSGPYMLVLTASANSAFVTTEMRLWEVHRLLGTFQQQESVEDLRNEILDIHRRMEQQKAMEWASQRRDFFFQAISAFQDDIAVATVSLLAVTLQYHYFLSRRGSQLYLAAARDILVASGGSTDVYDKLPHDPRALIDRMHLHPVTTTYISCPSCHHLYPYNTINPDSNPSHCIHQNTISSSPCASDLFESLDRGPLGIKTVPVRLYHHQSLKWWLGRLLARPGIEDILESYPHSLLQRPHSHDRPINDIWEARVLRTMKDANGVPFIEGDGAAGHSDLKLVLGLSVDGFDPFGNKAAKQSAAATAIWMVLYNFPPHLRYLPQNIYLAGIIPGPTKPSNDQINHYIQLVVDDLKELWTQGFFYTRTFKYRRGRKCKGMLVPLICDLLAARQVIGYPGSTTAHYFCTACDLDVDDISFVDRSAWPRKDKRHIRRYAQLYRDAESDAAQAAFFEASGWRWSPLLELEYWDPVEFTVIDSMHTFDLNMLQNHVRNLFQIDMKNESGTALRPPRKNRPKRIVDDKRELASLKRCQTVIYENGPHLLYELLELHRKVLYTFSLDYDIRSPENPVVLGTRWVLAKGIYLWRQQPPSNSQELQSFMERYPDFTPTQEGLIAGDADDGDDGKASPSDTEDETEGASASSPPPFKRSVIRNRAQRLLNVVSAEDPDLESRDLVYRQTTTQILAYFCDYLHIDRQDIMLTAKAAKMSLFNLLLQELQRDAFKHNFLGLLTAPEVPVVSSNAFLGRDIMAIVWDDMKRTQLPSWINLPPRDWGTARRGKLSADNWRVICCIHLPITLIRLLGDRTDRTKDLLDNFMKLVTAVRIATMRISSSSQIETYNEIILEYTQGVQQLFPDYQILPSHHAALHLGDFLERFGPKHAHDSPYYERCIKFFHRMNTNKKMDPGQLEGTLLRTTSIHANLLALLDDSPTIRANFSNMLERLRMHERERLRGFRLGEMLDSFLAPSVIEEEPPSEVDNLYSETLDDGDYSDLCQMLRWGTSERDTLVSRAIAILDSVSHRHSVYATSASIRYRDSGVLFQTSDGEEEAALIRRIFLHRHTFSSGEVVRQKYLVLQKFRKQQTEGDPYRCYGHAGGFSCDLEMGEHLVVAIDSVICHVAITRFDEENFVHILPIDRMDWLERGDKAPHTDDVSN